MTEHKKERPIFNDEYAVQEQIGSGQTSKVYLAHALKANLPPRVAIKIYRTDYLRKDRSSMKNIEDEIKTLKRLDHMHVVKLYDYGDKGVVRKSGGHRLEGLVYTVMEYIESHLLFDLCKSNGAMGEELAKHIALQMIPTLEYLQSQNVAHRDLKLENILFDADGNIKIADFGYASRKNITSLRSYRGTHTYMAPEIKEGKVYDGSKADLFSFGVILFIIAQGIFPFKEARPTEYYYNLLITGQCELYFIKTNASSLSHEFKDFYTSLVKHDPAQRPSLQKLSEHPWIAQASNPEKSHARLIECLKKTVSSDCSVDKSPSSVNSSRPASKCLLK
jgi:serine/threonine protein kinase